MNPMDNAWLLLKQKSYKPKAHLAQGAADLYNTHNEEKNRLKIQQFADGFSTSHQPSQEEQDQQARNLRERQEIERNVFSAQTNPYGSPRYREGPTPQEQRRLQRGERDLAQMQGL